MSLETPRLAPLFSPSSLVIVGASRHAGKLGHTLLANALSGGFAGAIHAVNPHGGEILGHPVLPGLAACPRGVELAVLALPAPLVQEQARLAISRGCSALVVLTDGFRELDEEGAKREAALARLCREREVLLLGPNSLGVIHRQHGLNASLNLATPPVGGISLLSQSGAVCAAALDWMASRNLGLSKMVSLGNEAGLTDAQCMAHLAHDPDTRVIACYLEWVTDGAGFLRAATEASRVKPVILLLGGSSEWYKRPGMRQSGFLIHSPDVLAAACDRTGIIQVNDFQGWLDALLVLALSPPLNNSRIAIITNGTGPGMLASDMVDRHGLDSVELAPALAETLLPRLPRGSSLQGPLDLTGVALPEHFRATAETVGLDPRIDALVTVVTPQPLTRPVEIVQAVHAASSGKKPLLAVLMGGVRMRPGVEALDRLGVASYPTPERAAAALTALNQYSRWRRRGPRVIDRFAVNQVRVRRLIQRCTLLGIRHLTDLESKRILQAYGIIVPEGGETGTVDGALELAERLGYPVALHLLSPELHLAGEMDTHLPEVTEPRGVVDGFDLLTLRFAKRAPEGRLDGVFVEKNVAHGRPMLIGMKRDWQFGPLLHVGSADPLSLDDAPCQLAPLTSGEAMAMLRAICRQKPMNGLCDDFSDNELQLVAEVLQRISQLAMDFPEIHRIQINPLVIRRAGIPPVATACEIRLLHEEPPP